MNQSEKSADERLREFFLFVKIPEHEKKELLEIIELKQKEFFKKVCEAAVSDQLEMMKRIEQNGLAHIENERIALRQNFK